MSILSGTNFAVPHEFQFVVATPSELQLCDVRHLQCAASYVESQHEVRQYVLFVTVFELVLLKCEFMQLSYVRR